MILAGDIGGTKTVLQLLRGGDPAQPLAFEQRFADDDFASFDRLLERFLDGARASGLQTGTISAAVLALAAPVEGECVRLTNRDWTIDAHALRSRLGIAALRLVNDFEASAHGVARLAASELVTLQAGQVLAAAPRVVLGAGTGLGLAWIAGDGTVIAGEGGNAAFAPPSATHVELLRFLTRRQGFVAVEDVVSGRGLANIHDFLLERSGAAGLRAGAAGASSAAGRGDRAADISAAALAGTDPLARQALELFIEAYGALAGDCALAAMARGGVYVAGGIAARILPLLREGGFVRAFRAKGRYLPILARMPVQVVTSERLALLGCAALAAARL